MDIFIQRLAESDLTKHLTDKQKIDLFDELVAEIKSDGVRMYSTTALPCFFNILNDLLHFSVSILNLSKTIKKEHVTPKMQIEVLIEAINTIHSDISDIGESEGEELYGYTFEHIKILFYHFSDIYRAIEKY